MVAAAISTTAKPVELVAADPHDGGALAAGEIPPRDARGAGAIA